MEFSLFEEFPFYIPQLSELYVSVFLEVFEGIGGIWWPASGMQRSSFNHLVHYCIAVDVLMAWNQCLNTFFPVFLIFRCVSLIFVVSSDCKSFLYRVVMGASASEFIMCFGIVEYSIWFIAYSTAIISGDCIWLK